MAPLGYATLCVNSPLRFIPHSGRSASAPSPANHISIGGKKLGIVPGSAHKVVARKGACLQLPVLELLRFAVSSTGRAQLRNVAGQLGGARQAREDREQQNGKEKEQSVPRLLIRKHEKVSKINVFKGREHGTKSKISY